MILARRKGHGEADLPRLASRDQYFYSDEQFLYLYNPWFDQQIQLEDYRWSRSSYLRGTIIGWQCCPTSMFTVLQFRTWLNTCPHFLCTIFMSTKLSFCSATMCSVCTSWLWNNPRCGFSSQTLRSARVNLASSFMCLSNLTSMPSSDVLGPNAKLGKRWKVPIVCEGHERRLDHCLTRVEDDADTVVSEL